MYFSGLEKLTTEENHIRWIFWTDAALSENLMLFNFFFFFALQRQSINKAEILLTGILSNSKKA